jgi:hypothetical protein
MRKRAVLIGLVVLVVIGVTGAGLAFTRFHRTHRTAQPAPVPNSSDSSAAAQSPAASGSASAAASASPSHSATPGLQAPPHSGRCPAFPAFPNASCTGVPPGVTLTAYPGPCTITANNTVVKGRLVNCDLDIRASGVVIQNTKVNGLVYLDSDNPQSAQWSFTLEDSEVDAGQQQRAAVSTGNMTVIRANIHGGVTAAQCEEHNRSCTIQDSWLHGQYIPADADWHLGGFLSDGGGNIRLVHNTIVCDHPVNPVDGGCTGDINFIPNFAPISGALIQNNLLGANLGSAYSTYGGDKPGSPYPHSDHMVYRDNIFQRGSNGKGSAYGPVAGFNTSGPGNQWINNRWDDGGSVEPSM